MDVIKPKKNYYKPITKYYYQAWKDNEHMGNFDKLHEIAQDLNLSVSAVYKIYNKVGNIYNNQYI